MVDGDIDVDVASGAALDFAIDELNVQYGGRQLLVDSMGDLDTNSAHTDFTFSGQGAITWGGSTYGMTIANVERHMSTDCYPESGTITVMVTSAEDGKEFEATISFEDDALGLDSDDTGLVYVTLNGEQHTAKLPSRTCTGF